MTVRRRLSQLLARQTRRILRDPTRGLAFALLMLCLLIIVGTLLYIAVENMSFVDALYMTVITVTTVGFGEVQTLSSAGRLITIGLILMGVGIAGGALSYTIGILGRPKLWLSIRRRTMERLIMKLENHYIVCGYGQMGRHVAQDLQTRGQPYVIVDLNLNEDRLLEQDIPFVAGDATMERTLLKAGIKQARGIVVALDSDSDNVMTVLTARELNADLFIVARVTNDEIESKLRRAGADRVINSFQLGGHRMALSLLRPAVSDFLEHIFLYNTGLDIEIGQVFVLADSALAGKSIATCRLREDHQVNILALRKPDGALVVSPGMDTILEPDCELVVIGPIGPVSELEALYGATGPTRRNEG